MGYSLEGALQKAFELTIAPPRLMVLLAGLTAMTIVALTWPCPWIDASARTLTRTGLCIPFGLQFFLPASFLLARLDGSRIQKVDVDCGVGIRMREKNSATRDVTTTAK